MKSRLTPLGSAAPARQKRLPARSGPRSTAPVMTSAGALPSSKSSATSPSSAGRALVDSGAPAAATAMRPAGTSRVLPARFRSSTFPSSTSSTALFGSTVSRKIVPSTLVSPCGIPAIIGLSLGCLATSALTAPFST